MVDGTADGEPPVTFAVDADDAFSNLSTLFLAFITLAIYLLFLKPTAGDADDAVANETAADRGRQRQRGAARRPVPQQQQTQQAPRRRLHLSENAMEVLETCRSHPPHVVPSSIPIGKRSIGGFDVLSESGLVAFAYTEAAADASTIAANAISPSSKSGEAPAAIAIDRAAPSLSSASAPLLQRKERAKILSRLFAARETAPGQALPSPPAKGSTFVVGVSKARHLADSHQRSSLVRVVKGLAAHYTVLVVVSPGANDDTDGGYETTRSLHSEAENLLRDGSTDDDDDDDEDPSSGLLPASVLPSHRILLAGTATGRVALVRQLSTNIGLTVDFDTDVREELERFGYEVSIVDDWTSILPAAAGVVAKPSSS